MVNRLINFFYIMSALFRIEFNQSIFPCQDPPIEDFPLLLPKTSIISI